jgi:hypothetical protein
MGQQRECHHFTSSNSGDVPHVMGAQVIAVMPHVMGAQVIAVMPHVMGAQVIAVMPHVMEAQVIAVMPHVMEAQVRPGLRNRQSTHVMDVSTWVNN